MIFMTKSSKSLYIDISRILGLADGQSEEIPLKCEVNDFQLPELLPDDRAKIQGRLKVTKIQNQVLVEIRAITEITIPCSRCLKLITSKNFFQTENTASFSPNDEGILIEKDKINIYPLLRDTILLEIPTRVLCKKNCQGLCPVCGKNRNIIRCCCQQVKNRDNPFYKLKSLIKKKPDG